MAELTPADVSAYTKGRLDEGDPETQRMLDAALASARRYCQWHVSPVKTGDVLTLDGPCGRVLDLPTRRLSAVTTVTEDGTTVDVTKLNWSENGSVRKSTGRRGWSCNYRSIVATITHGYTEEEAAGWRQAILEMVAEMSQMQAGEPGPERMTKKRVDDVEYDWSEMASRAVYSVNTVLDDYRRYMVLFA